MSEFMRIEKVELDPLSVDHAWYMVQNPSEFEAEDVAEAQRTLDESPLFANDDETWVSS